MSGGGCNQQTNSIPDISVTLWGVALVMQGDNILDRVCLCVCQVVHPSVDALTAEPSGFKQEVPLPVH